MKRKNDKKNWIIAAAAAFGVLLIFGIVILKNKSIRDKQKLVVSTSAESIKEVDKERIEQKKQEQARIQKRVTEIIKIGKDKRVDQSNELITILKSKDSKFEREAAALSLGYMGELKIKNNESKIKETLKNGLKDSEGAVRMRCALSLARFGDESAVDAAVKELSKGDDTGKFLAGDVLAAIPSKATIEKIKPLIKNDNSWTRINAKIALSKVEYQMKKTEDKVFYLETCLSDAQYEVCKWAAMELEKNITKNSEFKKASLEALKKCCSDDKSSGRFIARRILANIGSI